MKNLTPEQLAELRHMVEQWVDEGHTSPPYTAVQYDLFEWLGVAPNFYDVRRPTMTASRAL